jgi:hypothetical protein
MDNIKDNDINVGYVPIIGKTIKIDDDNKSTALVIPKEFAMELEIENSKVSMFLLDD